MMHVYVVMVQEDHVYDSAHGYYTTLLAAQTAAAKLKVPCHIEKHKLNKEISMTSYEVMPKRGKTWEESAELDAKDTY